MSLTYSPDALNGTIASGAGEAGVDLSGRTWESTVEMRLYSASAFEWSLGDGVWVPVIAGAPFSLPLSEAHAKVVTRNRGGTVYFTLLGSATNRL